MVTELALSVLFTLLLFSPLGILLYSIYTESFKCVYFYYRSHMQGSHSSFSSAASCGCQQGCIPHSLGNVLISTTVKPFGIWFLHYERPKNQNTSTVRATAEAGWEEAKNTAETGQTRNINDSEA